VERVLTRKFAYPFGFISVFLVLSFLIQVLFGLYWASAGVNKAMLVSVIRDQELLIQVVSILLTFLLFEWRELLKFDLRWPRTWLRAAENFFFTAQATPAQATPVQPSITQSLAQSLAMQPHRLQASSPLFVFYSSVIKGAIVGAVVFIFLIFFGALSWEPSSFTLTSLLVIVPYFLVQSMMFLTWFVLLSKLRARVVDALVGSDMRFKHPFLCRVGYLFFEAYLVFRVFEMGGLWQEKVLLALMCLLLAATPLLFEEELRHKGSRFGYYFWKRRIEKLGMSSGFWLLVFYLFGWGHGLTWRVPLFSSVQGPIFQNELGYLFVFGVFVISVNSLAYPLRFSKIYAPSMALAYLRRPHFGALLRTLLDLPPNFARHVWRVLTSKRRTAEAQS
jgi:hypothetical protein